MNKQPNPSEWVENYSESLYSLAYFRTRNRFEAEEAVQETFFRGLRKLDTFAGKSTVKTWLTGILKNVLHERFRKEKRRVAELNVMESKGLEVVDLKSVSPDRAVEHSEFWELVGSCLARLPKKTADIFWAKEVEGLSTATIAAEQGVTDNNVWVSMHRARSFLRECLDFMFGKRNKKPGRKTGDS
jgi:RNA polymerase sigma-70 factor (ECF subfamily)